MYDRIEAKKEPNGVRVRLHHGADRIEDFMYEPPGAFPLPTKSIRERVAATYGVPISSVDVVREFENERK